MRKVNAYNFTYWPEDKNFAGTVMYHALAESKERAIELAKEAGYDIEGLEVELEREDVRDMLHRPYPESIKDAQVR